MLISFISLQLGIFNLLPIPVLDGGVILLLVIEGLIRHDLSVSEREVRAGRFRLLVVAGGVPDVQRHREDAQAVLRDR